MNMEMLRDMVSGSVWEVSGTPEELLERLKKGKEKLLNQQPCPFKVGDIVTAKKGCGVKGRGIPHEVIAVYPEARRDFIGRGDPADFSDMEVLCADGGDRNPLIYRQESGRYELWDAEKLRKSQE